MLCVSDLLAAVTRPNHEAPVPERVLHLKLGRACNMSCPHCYSGGQRLAQDDLPTDRAMRVLDRFARAEFETVALGGGEPLIRDDLETIVARGAEHSLRIQLYTNGLLLTRDRVLRLREAGLSGVYIGIDGTRSFHDVYRGHPEAYESAVQALELASAEGLHTGARMTVTRRNLGEVDRLLEEVRFLPIDEVHIVLDTGDQRNPASLFSLRSINLQEIAQATVFHVERYLRLEHGPKVWISDEDMFHILPEVVAVKHGRRIGTQFKELLADYAPRAVRVVVDQSLHCRIAA